MSKKVSPGAAAPSVEVCKFDLSKLRQLIVHKDVVPEDAYTVLIVDYARASGPKCDDTAILAAKIFSDGVVHCYYILEIKSGRFGILELPHQVVEMAHKHSPSVVHIERLQNWELIQQEIARIANRRGINFGRLNFFKPSKKPGAKADRMGAFGRVCDRSAVKFVSGNWIEKLFGQLEKFTFERTNRGRRDDCADVASLLVTHA